MRKDEYRQRRALELMLSTGKSMTKEINAAFEQKTTITSSPSNSEIGTRIERKDLKPLVQRRTQKMIENGLVEEVKQLLGQRLENWAPLQSIGYKEVISHLKGQTPQEDLLRGDQ
ncbi:MAG: tRNA dimethylallyltransferase [Bdellovibrionales bacterium]